MKRLTVILAFLVVIGLIGAGWFLKGNRTDQPVDEKHIPVLVLDAGFQQEANEVDMANITNIINTVSAKAKALGWDVVITSDLSAPVSASSRIPNIKGDLCISFIHTNVNDAHGGMEIYAVTPGHEPGAQSVKLALALEDQLRNTGHISGSYFLYYVPIREGIYEEVKESVYSEEVKEYESMMILDQATIPTVVMKLGELNVPDDMAFEQEMYITDAITQVLSSWGNE
ncbi:MAG: hypothetical protein HUJ57_08355 [Erysipelotrichaceae bacterium]|nr:hypothetical protein [Erysipelotrichaceae bacterium]